MPYTEIFLALKNENFQLKNLNVFFIFAQNIDGTHNLCFGAKIRNIGIPMQTPVFLYKSGGLRGYTLHGHVFIMR